MTGLLGKACHFIRKRDLNHQHFQVVTIVENGPQGVIGFGIAANGEYTAGILNGNEARPREPVPKSVLPARASFPLARCPAHAAGVLGRRSLF